MVALSNSYLMRAARSMVMSSTLLQLNLVSSRCLYPRTIRKQTASLNASTRPSSRRLLLTSIHATKPGIEACLSSPTPTIHPYKRQQESALFEHSMGATLGSHQNRPLTSIPNLPTWMVPLGGSISNKCYLSFDKQALETYKSHNNAKSDTTTLVELPDL